MAISGSQSSAAATEANDWTHGAPPRPPPTPEPKLSSLSGARKVEWRLSLCSYVSLFSHPPSLATLQWKRQTIAAQISSRRACKVQECGFAWEERSRQNLLSLFRFTIKASFIFPTEISPVNLFRKSQHDQNSRFESLGVDILPLHKNRLIKIYCRLLCLTLSSQQLAFHVEDLVKRFIFLWNCMSNDTIWNIKLYACYVLRIKILNINKMTSQGSE